MSDQRTLPWGDCDATELARRVRDREASPTELVDAALGAIDQVDPRLHAVVHRMDEQARAAARGSLPDGPFRGVPMVVKDFDGFVAGVPFTASTRFLDGFVPDQESVAISRLRQAGLVFLAKTNLPELAIIGTTENEWRGPTHNPWSLEHTAGGSSGGSAALVAARAVPVAHGGDGGGSLRIPASGSIEMASSRGVTSRMPVRSPMNQTAQAVSRISPGNCPPRTSAAVPTVAAIAAAGRAPCTTKRTMSRRVSNPGRKPRWRSQAAAAALAPLLPAAMARQTGRGEPVRWLAMTEPRKTAGHRRPPSSRNTPSARPDGAHSSETWLPTLARLRPSSASTT